MRKIKIEDADIMKVAVQQEIVRSEESLYDHRLHGILMVCSGLNCYKVAELLGRSPRTVHYWVRRFQQSGFAGLQGTPRSGRPSLVDENIRQAIGEDLRQSPRQLGYAQNQWDGKLLSHHLAHKFCVQLGVRQCQRLFHQLGFRRRKSRHVIDEVDKVEQKK